MYEDDAPPSGGRSSLDPAFFDRLVMEAAHTPSLRPAIPRQLVEAFEQKRQRTHPGYAPADGPELLAWVTERLAIPLAEWRLLLSRMKKDGGDPEEITAPIKDRLTVIPLGQGEGGWMAETRTARRLTAAFFPPEKAGGPNTEPEDADPVSEAALFLGQWLSYYGPMDKGRIRSLLGLEADRLDRMLSALEGSRSIVAGPLTQNGTDQEICDAKNFETLVRMARRSAASQVATRPIQALPLFLAQTQGLTGQPPLEKNPGGPFLPALARRIAGIRHPGGPEP